MRSGGNMPIRRRTLTQAEQNEYLVRAEQLGASGVEIEISERWRERTHPLDILVAPPPMSTVCEFRTGVIGYAPFVRLLARSAVTLTDSDISTVFDDQIVLGSFHDEPICRLGTAEYSPSEVLNLRIERGLRLSRGQMVEGYILATGLQRVPIEYGEFPLPFEIVFMNQFGDEFPNAGMFAVLRAAARAKTVGRRWGTGLYGEGESARTAEVGVRDNRGNAIAASTNETKVAE
jgi:hypothetical protein